MTTFEFATATRIVFGSGALDALGPWAATSGRKALLVRGRAPQRGQRAADLLALHGVPVTELVVTGEPDITVAQQGVDTLRASGCDMVVAIGGGSVLDAGKAVAALAANPGDALDYLEVVGRSRALVNAPFPFAAVPTTAGTGSEVTRNAVLGVPGRGVKVSLRSPLLLARLAIVDPDLTRDLPPDVTASTGLDALTQLIEPYVSGRSSPMTDPLCTAGIRLVARSLEAAVRDGGDRDARAGMSLAAMWSGMALANAGLGAVHGLAGPLGGHLGAPHGVLCASLLPFVMQANLDVLPESHLARARYGEIAQILTGQDRACAADGVAWVRDLVRRLGIPGLGALGLASAHVRDVAVRAREASSMRGNPVPLSEDTLAAILRAAS